MSMVLGELSLRAGSGMKNNKVGEKRRFRDACDTGRGEWAAQGRVVRKVGREARNSNTRARKCKSTSMLVLKAKGKWKLWIRDYEKVTKNFYIDPRNKIKNNSVIQYEKGDRRARQ